MLALSGCSASISSSPIKSACSYNNTTYSNGETFQGDEDCKTYTCEDGKVTCTEEVSDLITDKNPAMCETVNDCEQLDLDSSFCTEGEWSCINFNCEFACDISGLLE